MPNKQKIRRRPLIHTIQEVRRQYEEYPLCERFGCRNVVALWTGRKTCSRCRRQR